MSKVLRLQIAVEAETRKQLQVGVNEALAAVMRVEDAGQITRPERRVWFTVESSSIVTEPEPPAPVLPEPEVGVVPPIVPENPASTWPEPVPDEFGSDESTDEIDEPL